MTTSGGGVLARTAPIQGDGDSPILIPPLQLRVEPVKFAHVSPFIREYHYLKRNPPPPVQSFAVFHEWRCVGALVFGQPAARMEDQASTWELRRYWLSDECAPNSESRVLGYCIRWIRKHKPHVRRLISYSDTSQGHTGIIYKATGWRMIATVKGRQWNTPSRPRRDVRSIGDKLKWELAL